MKLTSLIKMAFSLLVGLAAVGNLAKANPLPDVNGSIDFDGSAKTNTGNLVGATAITSITAFTLGGTATGDYASVPAFTPVTFKPFSFGASSVTPLWTFTVAGITYSFNATSISVDTQTKNFLNLSGIGWANITGHTSVLGDWSITETSEGNRKTFTFGSSAAVPDAGTTALMIGLGMGAICLSMVAQRRKLAKV